MSFVHLISGIGLDFSELVPRVLKIPFTVLHIIHRDRSSRSAFENVISVLANRYKQQTLNAFSRALQRHCNALVKRGFLGDIHPNWILFRWSCFVACGAADVFVNSQDAVNIFVGCQIHLLGSICQSSNSHTLKTALTALRRCLLTVRLSSAADVFLFALVHLVLPFTFLCVSCGRSRACLMFTRNR